MKTNKFLIILLLFQIYCCCTNSMQEKKGVTSLNMNDASEINFDMLVEDVNCTIIENSPDANMIDCWKIIKYKDLFFLYSLSDFVVCVIDKDGNLIKRIDGKGKGAIETPSDIFIDKSKDQLWIIDSRHFINKYTLKGDFVTREELPFNAVKITQANNNSFIFYDGGFDRGSDFFVRQTSTNYETKKTFVEKDNKRYMGMPVSLFANDYSHNAVYSLLPHIDTIYISNKNNIFTPCFQLNFNKSLLTFDVIPKKGFSDKEMDEIIETKKMVYSLTGFYHASGMLFMQLHGKNDSFRAIDINTESVYKFNTLIDGIDMRHRVTTIQGSTDTSLLVSMSAKEFIEKYMKKNNHTHYKSVEKILKAPEKIENRILIEIKIKNPYEK